jgi:hypothetical protein
MRVGITGDFLKLRENPMNVKDALRQGLETSNMVAMGYLSDLTDEELMRRPCPGCNHINWQLGHLIASENHHVASHSPKFVKPLPQGFKEKYAKETVGSDDASQFCTKAELLQLAAEQRSATLAALDAMSEADLDKPSGIEYAPTIGALLSMEGSHWLMHAGQWAVVRRELGRAPLF